MAAAMATTEKTQRIIQIDFRQKLVNYFCFGQKAIKTQMGLTYKEIYNPDNVFRNVVKTSNK